MSSSGLLAFEYHHRHQLFVQERKRKVRAYLDSVNEENRTLRSEKTALETLTRESKTAMEAAVQAKVGGWMNHYYYHHD